MRHFLRIVFNAVTVLSLVLTIAGVAAWVHSTNHLAGVAWTRADLPTPTEYRSRSLGVSVWGGELGLTWHRITIDLRSPANGGQSLEKLIAGHPALSPPGGWTFATSTQRFGAEPLTWLASTETLGFGWFSSYRPASETNAAASQIRSVGVPLLLPLVLGLLLPFGRAIARWRRARRGDGVRCQACGYDLRATPERCPECGAVATAL